MIADDKLADRLRQIIPTKTNLALDLAMAVVGLGLACICHFLLKGLLPGLSILFFGMGLAAIVRLMERLTWRSRLLDIMKHTNDPPTPIAEQ